MKTKTIKEAIIKVLNDIGKPLSLKTIYELIIANDLYRFKAENPPNIVRVLIRRHCVGLDFPTASSKKYFQIFDDGTYQVINYSHDLKSNKNNDITKKIVTQNSLKELHLKYIHEFKNNILEQLKDIESSSFELFCKKLLEVYGFKELKITKTSKDGGIDGFGKLKVGISYLNVAFQSKRWKKTTVGRTEIDKFRGAIQGDYEQGIFITTSSYSKEALCATTKKGAVPIILIDGSMIVDIMIEKQFGINIENMPIYINALDEITFD